MSASRQISKKQSAKTEVVIRIRPGRGRKIAKGFRFVFISFGVLGLFGALLMGIYAFWLVGKFLLAMARLIKYAGRKERREYPPQYSQGTV